VCPRCKGRRRVQRRGSRTIHRLAGSAPPPAAPRRTPTGHPDGAHTRGSGGSGLGELVAILLAVALLGPAVAAAAAGLLHLVLIVAGVIVGVGATVLAALLVWR
jgi:hypothetical protein